MGNKLVKVIGCAAVSAITCATLASCGSSGPNPDYLIMAADDSTMPVYRAYYAVYGDSLQNITKGAYENYISKDDQYKTIGTSICDFNVTAGSSDPSEWEYEIKYFDEEPYDTDVLKTQLKEMNVHYVGEVYILITTFDGYVILQVDNTTENQSTYGMFRDGKQMTLPAGTDLSSLETFYKYGGDT